MKLIKLLTPEEINDIKAAKHSDLSNYLEDDFRKLSIFNLIDICPILIRHLNKFPKGFIAVTAIEILYNRFELFIKKEESHENNI